MKEGVVLCHDNVSIMTESILSDLHEHVPSQTQGNTFRKDSAGSDEFLQAVNDSAIGCMCRFCRDHGIQNRFMDSFRTCFEGMIDQILMNTGKRLNMVVRVSVGGCKTDHDFYTSMTCIGTCSCNSDTASAYNTV